MEKENLQQFSDHVQSISLGMCVGTGDICFALTLRVV
jgi:hypothetical protein